MSDVKTSPSPVFLTPHSYTVPVPSSDQQVGIDFYSGILLVLPISDILPYPPYFRLLDPSI